MKCCFKCKSPYGCANGACVCHQAIEIPDPITEGTTLIPNPEADHA